MSDFRFDELVVRAVMLGGGLLAASRSALGLPRAIASARWRPIDAEVIEADLPSSGDLKVAYRYTVDGHSFTGDSFYAGGAPGPTGDAAMVEYYKYRLGQRVVVYYDPTEPGRSALRRDGLWPTIAGLAAGVGLIGYSLLMGVLLK